MNVYELEGNRMLEPGNCIIKPDKLKPISSFPDLPFEILLMRSHQRYIAMVR